MIYFSGISFLHYHHHHLISTTTNIANTITTTTTYIHPPSLVPSSPFCCLSPFPKVGFILSFLFFFTSSFLVYHSFPHSFINNYFFLNRYIYVCFLSLIFLGYYIIIICFILYFLFCFIKLFLDF